MGEKGLAKLSLLARMEHGTGGEDVVALAE